MVRRPVVGQRRLAGPHVAADLDDLAGPGKRPVVGHAVEALDHLGPRRAEAELAASARDGIDAGGRHGDQRRGAGVDGQDGGADVHPLRLGGQVPHEARRVVAVAPRPPTRCRGPPSPARPPGVRTRRTRRRSSAAWTASRGPPFPMSSWSVLCGKQNPKLCLPLPVASQRWRPTASNSSFSISAACSSSPVGWGRCGS